MEAKSHAVAMMEVIGNGNVGNCVRCSASASASAADIAKAKHRMELCMVGPRRMRAYCTSKLAQEPTTAESLAVAAQQSSFLSPPTAKSCFLSARLI